MKPLIAVRKIRCASPCEAMWGALADTAQLNQAVGNNTLASEPIDRGSAARYLVRTRLYGLSLLYEELPFQWNRPEMLSITREFHNGPAHRYTYEHRLTELADGGTILVLLLKEIAQCGQSHGWLTGARVTEHFSAKLKGLDEPLAAVRLVVDG